MASLVAQIVKRLPAMRETQIQSLGREDPLEKEMATHSSILAWKISWMEEPGGLGSQRVITESCYWRGVLRGASCTNSISIPLGALVASSSHQHLWTLGAKE